jgi:hypothetical protein
MADASSPDSAGAVGRFVRALQLFRPRTLARLGKTDERLQLQIDALLAEVQTLKTAVTVLVRKERQLRAILETEFASNDQVVRFEALIRASPIAEHVRLAIEAATLRHEPFPHCVIDDLLPEEYYEALIAALPPVDLFADRPDNKQQLTVPLEFAPRFSMEVWRHMARVVAEEMIKPAILVKFREPLTEWLRAALPALGDRPLDRVRINCSDGRLLLRRPGYRIPPHRDPKWGFITCLMYLARDGDDERWGTQLYKVDGDEEAASATPHWIAESLCHLAGEVAFRPNRALVFLNSVGAHGASIPSDAKPADLERYAYQFRIGADRQSIKYIRAQLTPEQSLLWAGKMDHDYR